LLDLLCATGLGVVVLLGRVTEARTLWLLRGYLLLVGLAWVVQRYANLPLTSKLVDALVLACSLALAILWQGELRRLMELLGTGRLGMLFGNRNRDQLASGSVALLSEAAGRLSQARRGALIVVDLGSDLRPEDFLNPGIPLDAQLSVDLLLNLFAADTPLHDGAVLVKANRILAAGVILPLSRQGINRYGTRHLAALGSPSASTAAWRSWCRRRPAPCRWPARGGWSGRSPAAVFTICSARPWPKPSGRSVAKDTPDSRG
jgi:DNA integrity scanning protein DisA with diadenylate cyclase activity